MKYRIRMDGNGEFIIERKTFLFWRALYAERGAPQRDWRFDTPNGDVKWLAALVPYMFWTHSSECYHEPYRFKEVAHAVAILAAKKHQEQVERNRHKFSTIVKETL